MHKIFSKDMWLAPSRLKRKDEDRWQARRYTRSGRWLRHTADEVDCRQRAQHQVPERSWKFIRIDEFQRQLIQFLFCTVFCEANSSAFAHRDSSLAYN